VNIKTQTKVMNVINIQLTTNKIRSKVKDADIDKVCIL